MARGHCSDKLEESAVLGVPTARTPKAEDRVAGFRLRWNDGAWRAVHAAHEVMGVGRACLRIPLTGKATNT